MENNLAVLYISNCEGFNEYMSDGSCNYGLRMTLEGFENALKNFIPKNEYEQLKAENEKAKQLLKEVLSCKNTDKGICCQCREAINTFFEVENESK